MRLKKSKWSPASLAVAISLVSALSSANETIEVKQQREASVNLIRSGQMHEGLNQLRQLLEKESKNQILLADYIVLAQQHHAFKATDFSILKNIQISLYPEYGQVAVIQILRDAKQYQEAIAWVNKFQNKLSSQTIAANTPDKPSEPVSIAQNKWRIWQGVLMAEAQQDIAARQALYGLKTEHLPADYLSLLSYAYRLLDMPIDALRTAQQALNKEKNSDTLQQYVLALAFNSQFEQAQSYLQQPELEQQRVLLQHQVYMLEFSQRIQQAIQSAKNANSMNRLEQTYAKLDSVLADLQLYETKLPQDTALKQNFYNEYIYALSARQDAQQAIAQLGKTNANPLNLPAYVRHALANSYLKRRQPAQAEQLYTSLFTEKNYADYEVYEGLYYSLIAQEKYQKANQLIDEMDQLLPTFSYSEAKGVDKQVHADRAQWMSLKGLNYAYRNEHAKAERYFKNLTAQAPNNISYKNNLAMLQRWREKPLQAQHVLAQWNGIAPVPVQHQIERMQNAQSLGNIKQWRSLNTVLIAQAENDTGVQLSQKELLDRQRISFVHESRFAKNKADQTDILGQLRGSEEKEHWTRINSPWLNEHYRVFADHVQRSGEYETGVLKDQRLGVGLEWVDRRKSAALLLTQSTEDDRFGVDLNWTHWLNDHWNYRLAYNSQADIPLQAIAQGQQGQSYQLALNWQQNESRKAGTSYQQTRIDDGNTRHEFSGYLMQQLFQAPHHKTTATLSTYYGKNDVLNTPYFNPEQSYSTELTFAHDWMTWRQYDQHFSQHFALTAGVFGQKNYSDKAIYNLLYQHNWQLSRTLKLNYGVGWGVHPYDGNDEKSTYAVLGLEGHF